MRSLVMNQSHLPWHELSGESKASCVAAEDLLDKGGGDGNVLLELGNFRVVLRVRHSQQTLILVVHHQNSLGASLLGVVRLFHKVAFCAGTEVWSVCASCHCFSSRLKAVFN